MKYFVAVKTWELVITNKIWVYLIIKAYRVKLNNGTYLSKRFTTK